MKRISNTKPKIFSFAWWTDIIFFFFVIYFIVVKTEFHGFLRILLDWLFFILVYSFGFLKTILFKEFKPTIFSNYNSKKISLGARIYCGLFALFLLFGSFFCLWYVIKYWNHGFDSHLVEFFDDCFLWFSLSLPFGFMAYTGKKFPFYKWVNPNWGKKARAFIGLNVA